MTSTQTQTRSFGQINNNSNIINAIVMNDLSETRSLVNKDNVNNVLNNNGDTALIIACKFNRIPIISYLLNSLIAKIDIKNNDNEITLDLGTMNTRRFVYEYIKKIHSVELDRICTKLDDRTKEVLGLKDQLAYVQTNYNGLVSHNNIKIKEINNLLDEISSLKRDYNSILERNKELEKLLKIEQDNTERFKRKSDENEAAYLNLKKSRK